jgi:hypothetical protein
MIALNFVGDVNIMKLSARQEDRRSERARNDADDGSKNSADRGRATGRRETVRLSMRRDWHLCEGDAADQAEFERNSK